MDTRRAGQLPCCFRAKQQRGSALIQVPSARPCLWKEEQVGKHVSKLFRCTQPQSSHSCWDYTGNILFTQMKSLHHAEGAIAASLWSLEQSGCAAPDGGHVHGAHAPPLPSVRSSESPATVACPAASHHSSPRDATSTSEDIGRLLQTKSLH